MTLPTQMQTDNPWLSWSATISDITAETPGVATYDLRIDDETTAAGYAFQPGQFNMIYLPGIGEAAISISGDPASAKELPHTIREAGNVTQTLASMKVGDSIGIRGPFGAAWPMDELNGKDVILIAGGIGLAPIRPVVYQLIAERENYGKVSLLYGARAPAGLLYPNLIADWKQSIDVQCTVDQATSDWQGHVGVVTALLERLQIERPDETVLLTCGPEVMMWYTIQTALSRGLNDTSIWVSLERSMNCGIGLCGHCQLGPEFLCKDGPVFRYDKVASILKVEAL